MKTNKLQDMLEQLMRVGDSSCVADLSFIIMGNRLINPWNTVKNLIENNNLNSKSHEDKGLWFVYTNVDVSGTKENLINFMNDLKKIHYIKWRVKDSKLFDRICKNMNLQQSVFLDKRDKELEYLFQYGSVKPPKGLDNELYFTGSYEKDMEHFLKLANKLTKRIIK